MGMLEELMSRFISVTKLSDKLQDKVVDLAVSLVQSEVSLIWGLEEELEKLSRTRARIQALLSDAEDRRIIEDENVLLWLRQLKDVALDAEDLLDEVDTRIRVSRLAPPEDTDPIRKRKRTWYYFSSSFPYPLVLFRRRAAMEVVALMKRFDEIADNRKKLRIQRGDAVVRMVSVREQPQTTSIPEKCVEIVGRDSDRDEVVARLLGKSGGGFLVSIVGMGGLGKTTLARYVYNDERVEKNFSVKVWICVTMGSTVMKITREIIESIDKEECNFHNFDSLQQVVRERLSEKRFLLVLDNVGERFASYWEYLYASLRWGAEGSRVLITTRSAEASRRMRILDPFELKGLSDDDSRMLFMQKVGDLQGHLNLVGIAEEIVRKCQGSPLAAKSLGGLLWSRDEDKWRSVLTELWELPADAGDLILPTLKISYEYLPLHLKQCFAFCAIFPNDYEFERDELVKLWVAEGVIQQRGRRRLEAIGSGYFEDLLWRSFFQVSNAQKQKYTMPSMIHDLAQSVSKYECFRITENEIPPNAGEKARRSLLFHSNAGPIEFSKIHRFKSLRTLFLRGEPRVFIEKVPGDLFLKLRCLRVLDLGHSEIIDLPDSIGQLKLLRYLGLYSTRIERLPESVGDLYNLQTLELGECYRLIELPKETNKLVNLRHLSLHLGQYRVASLISMPPGIGKLTSLQTLSRFAVGTAGGCGITELRDLDIRGELCISKLENVVKLDDAKVINLGDKRNIHTLMLQWSNSNSCKVEEGIIDYLCPHTQLKKLWIDNYNGTNFPKWMSTLSFSYLTSLRLSYCKNWESFPVLRKLPKLMDLHIEGFHGLETMKQDDENDTIFPSLERLIVWDLSMLKEWYISKGEMPCLSELHISHCPKLKELPHIPLSLEKLSIRNCKNLSALPGLPSLHDFVIESCNNLMVYQMGKLNSLSSLTIRQIPRLKVFAKGLLQPLNAMKRLKIGGCRSLMSLAQNNELQYLIALEYLEIFACPQLQYFSEEALPEALKDFRVYDCPHLKSLPSGLHFLKHLQRLELRRLPDLESLPEKGLPSSLKYLGISDCPWLKRKYRRDECEDWTSQLENEDIHLDIDFIF